MVLSPSIQGPRRRRSKSTLRRVLAKVNPADLQRLTAGWAQATARSNRAGASNDDGDVEGGPPAPVSVVVSFAGVRGRSGAAVAARRCS